MNKIFRKINTNATVEVLCLALLVFFAYLVVSNNILSPEKYNNSDVHRGFQRGINVSQGVNSYEEFNPKLMLDQEKVPGFFPLYFYFMFVLARLADYSFVTFLDILRWVVFGSYIGLGVTVYSILRSRGKLLALSGSALFLLNRWTVNDVISLKQDTYVLFLLMISLLLLTKRPKLSFFLYGIATGIKHLTIFALPIYILELVRLCRNLKQNLVQVIVLCFLLISPILIPSLPYFFKNRSTFVNAILYNGTRVPESADTDRNSGLNKLFVLYNQDRFNTPIFYALPRIPLLVAVFTLSLALIRKKLDMWQYCAFVYIGFVAFNPVLYGQYFTWTFAFLPFLFPKNSLS